MIIFPVIILLIIIAVRIFKGMFASFLVLVATKSIMDAFWDVRVGLLSFSSIGGVIIPVLFYPVFFKIRNLPKHWISNARILFFAYSFGLIFALIEEPLESLELFIININIFMGFLLIPLLVEDKRQFQKLVLAIIISGIFPIVVSVFQFQTGIIFQKRATAGLARFVGLYHDAFPVRFYGLFTIFSCILYLSIFKVKKIGVGVLAGIIIVALFSVYLVFSKAAVVIIMMWVFLMIGFSQAKFKYAFFIALLVIPVYIGFGDIINDNIGQLFSKEVGYNEGTYKDVRYTLAGRGYIWDDYWNFWLNEQTPLFQWTGDGISRPAHNEFLRTLLANGILGSLLLCLFVFRMIKHVFKIHKSLRGFGLMLLSMFLIDSLGLTPGIYYYYNILVWGITGVLLSPKLYENIFINKE